MIFEGTRPQMASGGKRTVFIVVREELWVSPAFVQVRDMLRTLVLTEAHREVYLSLPASIAHHREFKEHLLTFLRAATLRPEALTLVEERDATLVVVSGPPKATTAEEINIGVRRVGVYDITAVFASNLAPREVMSYLLPAVAGEEPSEAKGELHWSDYLMIRPNMFGVGVDLDRAVKKLFGR